MRKPELTVVGRTSVWKRRVCAGGGDVVWTSWLHHRAYGTLGIYVPAHHVPIRSTLPDRIFVQITGQLQPLWVLARDDDPRAEDDPTSAPLLIQATAIKRCERAIRSPLAPLHQARIRSSRSIGNGFLASTYEHPDLVCLIAAHRSGSALAFWNQPYGISATVGKRRYIRYVLIDTHSTAPFAPVLDMQKERSVQARLL